VLVVPAAHAPVEHLDGEHLVAAVAEDEEVAELQVVIAGEQSPAPAEIHVAVAVEEHLHVSQPTLLAGLPQLHFAWLTAVQQLRELVRQPLHAAKIKQRFK
jgi:hypothetical protein